MVGYMDRTLHANFLLDKVCDDLDAKALCAAQATCQKWLERMGPSPVFWKERCASTWEPSFWWSWRQPVLAAMRNWQKVWFTLSADILPAADEMRQIVWFTLSADILPAADEMRQILSQFNPDYVSLGRQLPAGWALVIITGSFELAALEPPARFTKGKQKFGGLRIRTNVSSRSKKAHEIVKRCIERCESICEECGIDNCRRRSIWGYMCVRCKACGLSVYACRLRADQKPDGHWSGEGSWMLHTAVTEVLRTIFYFREGAHESVETTIAVCCFLDQLILKLQETDSTSGNVRQLTRQYRATVDMRRAAQAFLDQAALPTRELCFSYDLRFMWSEVSD